MASNKAIFLNYASENLELGDADAPKTDGKGLISCFTVAQTKWFGEKLQEETIDWDGDNYIYCELCDAYFAGSCDKHPLYRILDEPAPTAELTAAEEFAQTTTPKLLEVRTSAIPNAGLGVFALVDVPIGFMFGPYKGRRLRDQTSADSSGYSWEIRLPGGRRSFVDGSDSRVANWLRFVNSSRFEAEQNLLAFQYAACIWYRTFRPIAAGSELLVWYGDKYGESLGAFTVVAPPKRPTPLARHPFILS